MSKPVAPKSVVFMGIFSVSFIALLLLLQVVSVQADPTEPVTLSLKSATVKRQFLPLGIPAAFTPTWLIEVVDNAGNVGSDTSLALDSSDNPHISYYDVANGDLKYTLWNGTSWISQTIDSAGNVGLYSSLALDSSDNPHISYYDGTNGDLKYALWNGVSWIFQTVDSVGDVGLYTSLALDSSDNPHISYRDSSNYSMKYAMWNGASWTSQTVDSAGSHGYDSSVAIDSADNPHLSYRDTINADLKYAMWNGTAWISQTVDSVGDVGHHTSLALDSSDNPHISHNDGINGDLKYAMWNGTAWISQTVNSAGTVGQFTSLALDSSDNPHISYYDASNGDLKYAMWNGVSWISQTIDSAGNVGWDTSLALDSSNNPHISYLDASNRLKFAQQGLTVLIDPGAGGVLTVPALGSISFPANVFSEPVEATYTPLEDLPNLPDIGIYFNLDARFVSSGQPATVEPGQLITITIVYHNLPNGIDERTIVTHSWMKHLRPESASFGSPPGWLPEMSEVDIGLNRVTAVVNHLGIFSIFGEYNAYLPFIQP